MSGTDPWMKNAHEIDRQLVALGGLVEQLAAQKLALQDLQATLLDWQQTLESLAATEGLDAGVRDQLAKLAVAVQKRIADGPPGPGSIKN